MIERRVIRRSVPEGLTLAPSEGRFLRDRLRDEANRRLWLALLAVAICFAPYVLWLFYLADRIGWMRSSPLLNLLELIAFTIAATLIVESVLYRRAAVWKALRELGHDVCRHCGYWLRGLSDDAMKCPECGEKRERMPEARP